MTSAQCVPAPCSPVARLFYSLRPPPTARLISSSLLLTFLTCNSAFARCTPQALQKRQFCPPRSKKKINFSKTERLDQAASAIACFSHDATSQPRTRSPHQVLPSRSLSQHLFFSPAMESHHVVQNNVLVFCFLHCHQGLYCRTGNFSRNRSHGRIPARENWPFLLPDWILLGHWISFCSSQDFCPDCILA